MTLGLLIELEAFKHTEAIQEVSGQASSEASLEAILKKASLLLYIVLLMSTHFSYENKLTNQNKYSRCFHSLHTL